MIDRIKHLTDLTVSGNMYIEHTPTEYDREDLFLSPVMMNAKRDKEYILNQNPYVSEYTALTGYLRFADDTFPGDIFHRRGHESFWKMMDDYYNKPIEGLCTFDWQHSVADFDKVIKIGIRGLKEEINQSREKHTEAENLEFLDAIDIIADAIIGWAHKCAVAALEKSKETKKAV